MKIAGWLIGISCAVGIVSADSKAFAQGANRGAQHPESQWSTIQLYCFGCHNDGVRAGNLFLDQLSAGSVAEHPEIFEKVVRKLRGRSFGCHRRGFYAAYANQPQLKRQITNR